MDFDALYCFLQAAIEKANPHSVERECGEYYPHLWSQSLYILSCLLKEVTEHNIYNVHVITLLQCFQ